MWKMTVHIDGERDATYIFEDWNGLLKYVEMIDEAYRGKKSWSMTADMVGSFDEYVNGYIEKEEKEYV